MALSFRQMRERDAEIVADVKAGTVLEDIASVHGITRERVRQIARERGVRSVRGFNKGDGISHRHKPKLERVLDLYDRGMPVAHIAETVGATSHAVTLWLVQHRGYVCSRIETPWNEAEEAYLRQHYASKRGAAGMIAKVLGRPRNAIIGKAHRLGLSGVTDLYSDADKKTIRRLFHKVPVKELAKRLNRSVGGVRTTAWWMGLKRPLPNRSAA